MSSDFRAFGTGPGANTLSAAAYLALTSFLQTGFGSGIVASNRFNTVMRQATTGAAALAKFADDNAPGNAVDDGDYAALAALLTTAVDLRAGAAAASTVGAVVTYGTFSPQIYFNLANTGVTYDTQDGRFVRLTLPALPDMLLVTGLLVLTSKGSATGVATVGGWGINVTGNDPVMIIADGMTGLTGKTSGLSLTGTNRFELRQSSSTGDGVQVTDAEFTNTSRIHFSGMLLIPA